MARVFVSHASADAAVAAAVHRWLVQDGHQVFLDQDLRDGIVVGEEWEQRLHERLRWADAVVCVLTSSYVASVWCTAELVTAQNRGSRLLPVRAEPGVSHPLLTALQRVDAAPNVGDSQVQLAEALRRLDAAGGLGWPDDRSPFPGLRSFDTEQHRVFFGRAREVDQLATLLRSPVERAEGVALLLVGPSGCGKSSLVRAGLLPMMADEPGWVTMPAILPGTQPVAALIRALAATAHELKVGWSTADVRLRLVDGGLAELGNDLLLAAPGPRRTHLLLVVDQFEELLTQASPAERARFTELLGPAMAGPLHVVATVRPELLDQLLADPDLAVLPTRIHTLQPLRREALRAVIEGPAQLAGIGIDEDLVARLIADTDSGEALPLLAYALAQLADGVQRGGRLLASRYEQLGGVQGALARQADAALADAIAASGRDRDQVVKDLLRLVTVDEQGHPTRWRVRHDELPDPVAAEMGAFIARRLLTTDLDNGHVMIEVAHEAFLSAWPPLAEAIGAASTALRAGRRIEQATADWVQHGKAPDRLWERGQLAAALADTGAHLQASNQFFEAGAEHRQAARSSSTGPGRGWHPVLGHRTLVADRVELSAPARQFLHASIRRDRRRRRLSVTVLSVLLVAALIAASIAVIQRRASEERQRLATAELLLSRAEAILSGDPRTALQLGEAAYRIRPGPDTQAYLAQLLLSPVFAGHSGHSEHNGRAGHTDTSSAGDDEMALWSVIDRARPRPVAGPLAGHTDLATAVAFAPDGHTLATASRDGTVLLWDVADLTRPRRLVERLTDHADTVTALAFAPDGRTLATARWNGTVLLWELTDPTRPRRRGDPLVGHADQVTAVAFVSDGRTLATGSRDQTVLLWDVADAARPRRLGDPLVGHADQVTALAFAPDGRTLATASADRTVLLWDTSDPGQARRLGDPLAAHTAAVLAVAFSPNGQTLTVAGAHRAVGWDLTEPERPRRLGPRTAGNTTMSAVTFAPDGRTLAAAGADGTVFLWDLTDPNRTHRLGESMTDPPGLVSAVAFAPDGRTLATAGGNGTVFLWDLTGLNELRDDPLVQACAVTRGGLTPAEWGRHIPSLKFVNTCAR